MRQQSLASDFLGGHLQLSHGSVFDDAAIYTPTHQLLERCERSVCSPGRAVRDDHVEHAHYVGALDGVHGARIEARELYQYPFGAVPVFGALLSVEFDELRYGLGECWRALLCFMWRLLDVTTKFDVAQ